MNAGVRADRASGSARETRAPLRCRPRMSTMVELLLQEQRVHRQSESARPNRARFQKQPDEGSRRFCACLQSRITLTRAPDERRRAVAFENIDQQHLAATGLDDVVADDLLAGIVAALDQYARLHLRDQVNRRVLLEDCDQVDRLERRQHFRSRALVLHWTALAL